MNTEIPVTDPRLKLCQNQRLCWSSVFAGTFVGLGLGFLLNLYSVAIGLSAVSSSVTGANVIAIGGLLGLIVGVIAATMASGFVSGYLGRFHYYPLSGGILYGFVTWSLILFLSALMLAPIQHFVKNFQDTVSRTQVVKNDKGYGENTSISVKSSSYRQEKASITESVNVDSKALAWSGWLVFILFFIGAIFSCIGAIWGLNCKRDEVLSR